MDWDGRDAKVISHPLIWLDYLEDQGVDTVSTRAWALFGFPNCDFIYSSQSLSF
jgi:hypothetical protein